MGIAATMQSPQQIAPETLANESPLHAVRRQVAQLFECPQLVADERRLNHRRPFPYPIHLTPVDDEGQLQLADTLIALGKHFSDQGLDFYCSEALPYRRMVASIEISPNHWLGFLLDLSWCRFGKHGWYENGGKFLQVTTSPFGDPTPVRIA